MADQDSGAVVRIPTMLAVMRNLHTNEMTAVQRTALTPEGRKIGRRMLGVASEAAIKVDPDVDAALGLTVGEGLKRAWPRGLPASVQCGRLDRRAPSPRFRCCQGSRQSQFLARSAMAAQINAPRKHVQPDGWRLDKRHSSLRRLSAVILTTLGTRPCDDD